MKLACRKSSVEKTCVPTDKLRKSAFSNYPETCYSKFQGNSKRQISWACQLGRTSSQHLIYDMLVSFNLFDILFIFCHQFEEFLHPSWLWTWYPIYKKSIPFVGILLYIPIVEQMLHNSKGNVNYNNNLVC